MATELVPGEPVQSALSSGDPRFASARIDYYALQLADSATVDLRMTSAAFDPLLFLFGAPGDILVQTFDSLGAAPGEAETARLERRLAPGCHLVGASAWRNRDTGTYSLAVDTAAGS